MASSASFPNSKPHTEHAERTATEPRQEKLHHARICHVRNVNRRVRLLRLALPYAVKFLPGQWLDVHIPALPNHVGGFTITSTPAESSEHPKHDAVPPKQQNKKSLSSPRPFLELAIQKSSRNPSAAWLWRSEQEILDESVHVRVGGSFVWPPPGKQIRTALFVAGGVGINPLISMLSHLVQPEQIHEMPETIKLLYATKLGGGDLDQILFLSRLQRIFEEINQRTQASGSIDLHITDGSVAPSQTASSPWLTIRSDRITHDQLLSTIGSEPSDMQRNVAYVCGPPAMTDEFVKILESQAGMKDKVYYEKWW